MIRLSCESQNMLGQTNKLNMQFTGTGLNVLACLNLYNQKTMLITVVPDNHIGKICLQDIRKYGIDTSNIQMYGNHMGIYFYEQGFGRRPSYVTYMDREHSSFNEYYFTEQEIESFVREVDIVHLCGISLATSNISCKNAILFAKIGYKMGKKVVFDCNYRSSMWKNKKEEANSFYDSILKYTTIAFMSYMDADYLGINTTYKCEYEILGEILKKYNLEAIFGTKKCKNTYQGYCLNEEGILLSKKYTLDILDRVGTGDAFCASVIYYLNEKNKSYQETVEFATKAGLLAHTTYGDTPMLNEEEVNLYTSIERENLIR